MKQLCHAVRFIVSIVVVYMLGGQAAIAAPADFTELVKTVGPAVVNINTEKTVARRSQPMPPGFDMFRGHPDMDRFFEQFDNFHNFGFPEGKGQESKRHSLGSGFVISPDGYIVTNNHVIEGADLVQVSFKGKQKDEGYTAKVVGVDPETDLAVLKIEAKDLPYLRFGNSDNLQVGEWLIAIGNPLGLDNTVTAGILSAKGRNIHLGTYGDFLQTDASINPGNSGGPLLNMAGEVVGINTAIAQRAQGIGFAIPASMAQKIIDDLKNNRKVSRGWLGVTIQNVDAATAKALEMKDTSGALVGSVIEGEPADKAGIKSGDVIISINGEKIADTDMLLRKVALLTPGVEATVSIWRDGKSLDVVLRVADRAQAKASGGEPGAKAGKAAEGVLGLALRPLAEGDAIHYKLGKNTGLLITGVAPRSIAAELGLRKGDVLVSMNRKRVETVEQVDALVAEVNKKKGVLLLQVARNGSLFFRAVELTGN